MALLVIAGVVAFIFLSGQQGEESVGEIKIGATVSLSGKYSTEGQRVLNGYQMAVEEINDAGGIEINGSKYELELIYYDDQSDKQQASQLYNQLITQDEVNILLGPYSSSIVLNVAPVAESNQIPFIQAGGASDSIYQQGYKYVFGLYRVASTYTQPLFEWLNSSGHVNDVSSVAIFLEDSSFPNAVWNGAEKYIQNAGLTVIGPSGGGPYRYTSGDLDSIATSMSDL